MLKKFLNKIGSNDVLTNLTAVILTVSVVVAFYAISWICMCGIIKLITMCFGLQFKWSIATGIWLIVCIVKNIFSSAKSNK